MTRTLDGEFRAPRWLYLACLACHVNGIARPFSQIEFQNDSQSLWRIGVRAVAAKELTRESWLGNRHGWIAGGTALKGLSLLVTESTDGREVAVVASGPTDGLEFHELSLKLTGAGAYAAVKAFSCVDVVQNRPIAGIACLATDETAVTLDVEVYDGLTPEGDAYFARLQLGPSGLRLTKSLLANQERHPHATSLVVQPVAPHDFYMALRAA